MDLVAKDHGVPTWHARALPVAVMQTDLRFLVIQMYTFNVKHSVNHMEFFFGRISRSQTP